MSFMMTDSEIRIIVGDGARPFIADGWSGGSALQNPEMSRLQLAAMLRRAESSGKGSSGWAAFLDSRADRQANTNVKEPEA